MTIKENINFFKKISKKKNNKYQMHTNCNDALK